jgi:hypothetical protein
MTFFTIMFRIAPIEAVLLIFLGLLFTPATGASAAGNKLAVYLYPVKTSDESRPYADDINECLSNHLDYYLWQKGWEIEFLGPDSRRKAETAIQHLDTGAFDYLLQIEPEADIRSIELSSKQKGSTRYAGRLHIKAHFSIRKLGPTDSTLANRWFETRASDSWIEMPDSLATQGKVMTPEPPDFVVKRLLSSALASLPSLARKRSTLSDKVPVLIVVDSRIFNDWWNRSDSDIIHATEYASHCMEKQFGFGLEICGKDYITAPDVGFSGISSLFKAFLENQSRRIDTLVVGFYRPNDIMEFYRNSGKIQIGISELGRQTSLLAELLPPNKETSEWNAFLNGQLILHEIGHLLGAIHVSDIQSVMTIRTEWVSSIHFDTLNHYLIANGHKDKELLSGIAGYLDFLASAIEATGYKLSDYPAVFFSYLNLNRKGIMNNDFGKGIFRASIPYAARGYMQYLAGNPAFAEELFYKALAGDPGQGSIHYYLSSVTKGEDSRYHLKRAAEIGYYEAILERHLISR